MDRRSFLRTAVAGGAATAVVSRGFLSLSAEAGTLVTGTQTSYGPSRLVTIDGVRLELPEGFGIRMVAKSGEAPVAGGPLWHYRCDGGGITVGTDGRWFYSSNSELEGNEYVPGVQTGGGARALEFDVDNQVVRTVTMLEGTRHNCAGGTTPWGTWLSCEENLEGQVWECDPTGRNAALPRPALGLFSHEAAAVDETNGVLYLTEDDSLGRIYRFIPLVWGDLSAGRLQAAHFDAEPPRQVPDPVTAEYGDAGAELLRPGHVGRRLTPHRCRLPARRRAHDGGPQERGRRLRPGHQHRVRHRQERRPGVGHRAGHGNRR